MLWLYLLGAVTALTIALRRVVQRQTPLSDELYSTKVAFDHLQSGVAWVRADGTLGTVNASLAATLMADPKGFVGRDWITMFPKIEQERVKEAYSQMLILGKTHLETYGQRSDGSYASLNVLLVAVHDHKMRFVGHHCLVLDETRAKILLDRVKELERDAFSAAKQA
jgi:hypothetical protein